MPCCAKEKERCEYQRASKRNAVEKAARLQAEVDKLSSQAADAVDSLEAHTAAAEKTASEDLAVMPPTNAAGEIDALNKKLEETLEMAAAATEMAESEAVSCFSRCWHCGSTSSRLDDKREILRNLWRTR